MQPEQGPPASGPDPETEDNFLPPFANEENKRLNEQVRHMEKQLEQTGGRAWLREELSCAAVRGTIRTHKSSNSSRGDCRAEKDPQAAPVRGVPQGSLWTRTRTASISCRTT